MVPDPQRAEREAEGTMQRTRQFVGDLSLGDLVPSILARIWSDFIESLTLAVGAGSAEEQVTGSAKVIGYIVITSPITLFYSLILAVPFVVTLLLGFVRFIPAVDGAWKSSRTSAEQQTRRWKRD